MVEKGPAGGAVDDVPAGDKECDVTAVFVPQGVNFFGPAVAGTADRLIFSFLSRPPPSGGLSLRRSHSSVATRGTPCVSFGKPRWIFANCNGASIVNSKLWCSSTITFGASMAGVRTVRPIDVFSVRKV